MAYAYLFKYIIIGDTGEGARAGPERGGGEGPAPRAHFRSVGSAADVVAPREEEAVSPPRLCAGPRPRPRPCLPTALGPGLRPFGPGWRAAGQLGLSHGLGCGGRAGLRRGRRRCHKETYTLVVPVVCSLVAARPHSTPQFCDEFLSYCCELPSAQAARMLFPVSVGAAVANCVKTRCQKKIKSPGSSSLI